MKVRKILCFLILVALYLSCQRDTTDKALQQHLEDYETPEFQWKIILQNGSSVPFWFDDVKHLSEGLIPVCQSGLWGFIDVTGEIVIPSEYLEAHPFSEGLGRVRASNGLFGFINSSGSFVIPPTFEEAGDAHSGLIRVKSELGTAFIDFDQNSLTEKVFSKASDFSHGLALVEFGGGWYVMDSLGKILTPPFDQIIMGSKTEPAVIYENGKWIYQSTIPALNTPYDYVEPFFRHHAVVKTQGGWHILRQDGELIVSSPKTLMNLGYGAYAYFENGVYQITLQNQTLDLDGITEIHRMHDGYMVYRQHQSWNWLDATGRPLLDRPVSLAWDFEQGLAKFAAEAGIGVMDTLAQVILQPIYADVRILDPNGLFAVQHQ